jgi:uncharacterized protein (TIGR02246 family)
MRWLWTMVAVGALLGCQGSGSPGDVESGTLREQVLEADRSFDAAVAAGDGTAFADLIAVDAVFLGSTTLRGRDAIVEGWAPLLDPDGATSLRWQPASAEVSSSGDLAYTMGTYRLEARDETGQVRAATGEYVTVWRRQSDGRWRAAADSGTPPRPVEEEVGVSGG